MKSRIGDYYKSFRGCETHWNKGDLTPFLLLFTGIIEDALGDIKSTLSSKKSELMYYESILELSEHPEIEENIALAKILVRASLFSASGVSMESLKDVFSVTRQTIYRWMNELDKQEIVLRQKRGRAVRYRANLDKILELGLAEEGIQVTP